MVEGVATSNVSDNAQIPLMPGHKIGKVLVFSDCRNLALPLLLARKRGVATPFVASNNKDPCSPGFVCPCKTPVDSRDRWPEL
jgi:hypothetical protein